MKFDDLLEEVISERKKDGAGITFVDIDETLFRTFAKIVVMKDGIKVRELDNQEFNSYELRDGETYDFGQFKDAALFAKTSIPIPTTINRIKKMLGQITAKSLKSKVVFLTARADFDDRDTFLKVFTDNGIPVGDTSKVYIERTGNIKSGTIPEKKAKVMLKYLSSGQYTRCRLLDDHKPNIDVLKTVRAKVPRKTLEKIRGNFDIPPGKDPIDFFGLLVLPNGKLKRVV